MALFEQNCLREALKQACLFEELVEGINLVMKFHAQALAFAVENRNIPHRPLDAAFVKINDIAVFHVDDLLVHVDGDVRLGGEDVNLDFAIDEPAYHLRGWRQLAATRSRNKLDLKPVVAIAFC